MDFPLTNNPEENFRVSILDIIYNFRQLWSEYGYWTLDIKGADGNILVYGVKLITQEFLLQQYVQIPFDLKSSNEFDPTRNNLDAFVLGVIEKDV